VLTQSTNKNEKSDAIALIGRCFKEKMSCIILVLPAQFWDHLLFLTLLAI
jgi:hypothetical protein